LAVSVYGVGVYGTATYVEASSSPTTAVPQATGMRDVVIGRAGWATMDRLPVVMGGVSWRTDGAGSLSCRIALRDLFARGYDLRPGSTPIKGMWLWWEHATAGGWGGVITRTSVSWPWLDITAESFLVLLRARRVPTDYGPQSASPGSLAMRAIRDVERGGDRLQITGAVADESDVAVWYDWRGGDLAEDVLPELTGYGYQMRVRTDTIDERLFEFRRRLGLDRRGDVLLAEGGAIISPSQEGDLWTLANAIVGVSGESDWSDSTAYRLDDDASIRAYGRAYERTIAYPGLVTRSTIIPRVQRDLAARSSPAEVVTLDTVDAGYIWERIREGDTVTAILPSANAIVGVRIDQRTLDVSRGVQTFAGTVIAEAA